MQSSLKPEEVSQYQINLPKPPHKFSRFLPLAALEAGIFPQRKPPRPTTHSMSIGVDACAKVTASKILRPEQTHDCGFGDLLRRNCPMFIVVFEEETREREFVRECFSVLSKNAQMFDIKRKDLRE